jgi:hypothetical protein
MSVIKKIRSEVYYNLINIPGWRNRRRIVVIESDDWGSIRMPSKEVYKEFADRGLNLSNSDYNRIDTIESNEDLIRLYEVLKSFRDRNGNHPAITANVVVGNPDFAKIREADFQQYFYEPVTRTLENYPGRDQVEALWKEGNAMGLFHPQFHGREHVNVDRWMNALRKRTPDIIFTFNHNTTFSGEEDYNFMEVLDYTTRDEIAGMKQSLAEGLALFENIFGYRSKSFIPPCYAWDSEIEDVLYSNGVRYLQGLIVQLIPTGSFDNYRKRYHLPGSRNRSGLRHLVRNCFFEPALSSKSDVVGECLKRVNTAFTWNKPAIICAHRINFMGALDEGNRTENLSLLQELLRRVTHHWPDVEFMTSDQLGDLISKADR